jgi:hypothetical protein
VQTSGTVAARILARLHDVDPHCDLTSRDFTLTCDIKREFAGEPEDYIRAMENSYMFTLPGRSSQIFLNVGTGLFKRVANDDSDWIISNPGGSVLMRPSATSGSW